MNRILFSALMWISLTLLVFTKDNNIAQISLLTETTDNSGPFYIGIYFDMPSDWYIYWENPGDAGIPVDVQWSLPEGYTISDLIYPTPERFYTQGLISFGFKNEALLLAKVTPPMNDNPSIDRIISAKVSWMVCKESCILEDGTVELNLNEYTPDSELFTGYKNKLPKSLEQSNTRITSVETRREDRYIYITIDLEGEPVQDFFPGPVENFIFPHNEIEITDYSISYRLQPYSDRSVIESVSGLLFINDTAFQFNEPVTAVN